MNFGLLIWNLEIMWQMICHNYMLREFPLVSYINIVTDDALGLSRSCLRSLDCKRRLARLTHEQKMDLLHFYSGLEM
jgi:hypothetical protein